MEEVKEVEKVEKVEKVEILKGKEKIENQLLRACESGNIEDVKKFLDQGGNVNVQGESGETPLFIACFHGYLEIVKLLFSDKRVKLNKADNSGITPFYTACENGHLQVVKYLLATGRISLGVKNSQGKTVLDHPVQQKTVLDHAKEKGYTEIIELIQAFQKNPTQERAKLAQEFGFLGFLAPETKKIEVEKEIKREEKKEVNSKSKVKKEEKGSIYQIAYGELFKLRTTAQTFPEFENDLKSKIKVDKDTEIILHYKENDNLYILNDMDELEKGMTIIVSIPQPVQSENWNNIVFLSERSNSGFQIEIDPDDIPPQHEAQIIELMNKFSKSHSCLKFQATKSGIVIQVNFMTANKAKKAFNQIVNLLQQSK